MSKHSASETRGTSSPSYHMVPLLVVFSLGETLKHRRCAEESEEYFRNLERRTARDFDAAYVDPSCDLSASLGRRTKYEKLAYLRAAATAARQSFILLLGNIGMLAQSRVDHRR